jgi:iron-siderophore transport system substrate-binding protein
MADCAKARALLMPAACLVAAALLMGCGGGESNGTADETVKNGEAETRTVHHHGGTTKIPADPRRVVTVHDQHGLLPLWSLGFRDIVGSVGSTRDGERFFRRMESHGYSPSDVEWISPWGEPDLEAIAALNPDLIVGVATNEPIYEQLSGIAPTVLMNPWRDAPLREIVMDYARLVGLEDEADRLEAEYQEKLDALREAVDEPHELVISLIGYGAHGGAELGQFYAVGSDGHPVEAILRKIGFARPAEQLAVDERTYYSVERLRDHDGHLLLRMTHDQGSSSDDERHSQAIQGSPLWNQLTAVRLGQAIDLDGEAMVGGGYDPYITASERLLEIVEKADTSGDLSHMVVATPDDS